MVAIHINYLNGRLLFSPSQRRDVRPSTPFVTLIPVFSGCYTIGASAPTVPAGWRFVTRSFLVSAPTIALTCMTLIWASALLYIHSPNRVDPIPFVWVSVPCPYHRKASVTLSQSLRGVYTPINHYSPKRAVVGDVFFDLPTGPLPAPATAGKVA